MNIFVSIDLYQNEELKIKLATKPSGDGRLVVFYRVLFLRFRIEIFMLSAVEYPG